MEAARAFGRDVTNKSPDVFTSGSKQVAKHASYTSVLAGFKWSGKNDRQDSDGVIKVPTLEKFEGQISFKGQRRKGHAEALKHLKSLEFERNQSRAGSSRSGWLRSSQGEGFSLRAHGEIAKKNMEIESLQEDTEALRQQLASTMEQLDEASIVKESLQVRDLEAAELRIQVKSLEQKLEEAKIQGTPRGENAKKTLALAYAKIYSLSTDVLTERSKSAQMSEQLASVSGTAERLLSEKHQLEEQLSSTNQQLEGLEKETEEIRDSWKVVSSQLEAMKEHFQEQSKKLNELENEKAAAQTEVEKLRQELVAAQDPASGSQVASTLVEDLRNQLSAAQQRLKEAHRGAEETQERITQLEYDSLESQRLLQLSDVIREEMAEKEDYVARVSELCRQLSQKEEEIQEARAQGSPVGEGAKIVLPMALKRVKEKQEELKQVGSKCEELEGENEELRAAVEAEKARVARLEGEMDKVQAELRAARADLDAMEAAPLQASPVGSPLRAASPEAQALDATMAAIEGEMSHISSELGGSSLENRIVPYNSELMRTVEIQHERYRSLQAELQELRDDLVAKEQAALEQGRYLTLGNESIPALRAEVARLESEVNALEGTLKTALENASRALSALNDEIEGKQELTNRVKELEQQVSTTTSMLKAAQTLVKIREGDLERVQRRSDELEEVSAVQARRLRDACIDLAGLRELGSFERLRELVGQNRSMAVVASDKRSHSLARLRHSLERMERMDAKNESVNDDCMTILREREEAMAAMKSWKQRCISLKDTLGGLQTQVQSPPGSSVVIKEEPVSPLAIEVYRPEEGTARLERQVAELKDALHEARVTADAAMKDGKEAREESSRLAAEVARLEKAAQQQADAAKAATNALLEDMKQQVAAEVAACERQEVEHLSLEVEQLQKMNAAAKDAQHAAASMADGLKQQLAEALAKAEVALREKQGLEAEVAKHKLVQRATQDALEARDKVMGIQQQINEQQGHVIQVGKTRQAQLTAENATLKEEREAQEAKYNALASSLSKLSIATDAYFLAKTGRDEVVQRRSEATELLQSATVAAVAARPKQPTKQSSQQTQTTPPVAASRRSREHPGVTTYRHWLAAISVMLAAQLFASAGNC